jgi:hypothetical protein
MFDVPLQTIVCSIAGCVNDLVVIVSHQDDARVQGWCAIHYDAALDGITLKLAADEKRKRDRSYREAFELLSPLEQAELDGR